MKEYNDYDLRYPQLIMQIIEYFRLGSGINKHSILDFCQINCDPISKEIIYQPAIVNKICQKLCHKNIMSLIKSDGKLGLHNNYMVVIRDESFFETEKKKLELSFNSLVYGFEYIYNLYKNIVVPLVWERNDGTYSAGTGFKMFGGIVTAKHCITDPQNLSIKGYSADELEKSKIYVSTNPNLDIAFIDVNKKDTIDVFIDNGKVLQEVLVLGYPKIPAFTEFLTAEKATISSKAISRLTPTKGAIAAFGKNYLSRAELMLITAKIRGGNSGGPVISEEGCIVGVSCQIPYYEGKNDDYDDLGYGIVVPIKYLMEIINRKQETIDVPQNFYRDFIN